MRRTITKLAVNKASMLALSNQMTEQLGKRSVLVPPLVALHTRMCSMLALLR